MSTSEPATEEYKERAGWFYIGNGKYVRIPDDYKIKVIPWHLIDPELMYEVPDGI